MQAELAGKNPGMAYTVEQATDLPNGFAVAGRPLDPGEKAPAPLPQLQMSMAPKQPADLVPNADGGVDYGAITPEMGRDMRRQAGVIRLEEGDDSYGLRHIELRHGDQIRAAGYASVTDFVAEVANNIEQVWKPSATAQLVVVHSPSNDRVIFLELRAARDEAGDYYTVRTAFPARSGFVKNKNWTLLWEGRAQPSANSESSAPFADSPANKSGQGVTIPSGSTSNGNPTQQAEQAFSIPADQGAGKPEGSDTGVQQSREKSSDLAAAPMAIRWPERATVESVQAAVEDLVGANGRLPGGLGSVVVTTSERIKPDWEPLIGKVDIGAQGAGRVKGFYDPENLFMVSQGIAWLARLARKGGAWIVPAVRRYIYQPFWFCSL